MGPPEQVGRLVGSDVPGCDEALGVTHTEVDSAPRRRPWTRGNGAVSATTTAGHERAGSGRHHPMPAGVRSSITQA